LNYIIGLHEDLSEFIDTGLKDPFLADFAREWSDWRIRSTDPWFSVLIGVCQQNASFRQGWRMLLNIIKIYGRKIHIEGFGDTYIPPEPSDILRDPSKLIDAKVGYRAETIKEAAKRFSEKRFVEEILEAKSSEEFERELREIRGVGPYTARLALVLSKRIYERPPIDRWLRRIISEIYKVDLSYAEKKWIEIWGKWSGLASMAATIALDAEPLQKALKRIRERKLVPDPSVAPSPANMWLYMK